MKGVYMSQYIPDLTERFPEGFGGVDLTYSYFPSRRHWTDQYDYHDDFDYDDIPDDLLEDDGNESPLTEWFEKGF